ncbi:uncharacterized protein J3D65DRAFT_667561 [Phyllosticta citribraziliensis]|uniref:Uncharacterized protein n=1 Tax=Phyllosticta citribraziliensis TaxID=989973 RepID=A0ABR1LS75_9PEZI
MEDLTSLNVGEPRGPGRPPLNTQKMQLRAILEAMFVTLARLSEGTTLPKVARGMSFKSARLVEDFSTNQLMERNMNRAPNMKEMGNFEYMPAQGARQSHIRASKPWWHLKAAEKQSGICTSFNADAALSLQNKVIDYDRVSDQERALHPEFANAFQDYDMDNIRGEDGSIFGRNKRSPTHPDHQPYRPYLQAKRKSAKSRPPSGNPAPETIHRDARLVTPHDHSNRRISKKADVQSGYDNNSAFNRQRFSDTNDPERQLQRHGERRSAYNQQDRSLSRSNRDQVAENENAIEEIRKLRASLQNDVDMVAADHRQPMSGAFAQLRENARHISNQLIAMEDTLRQSNEVLRWNEDHWMEMPSSK